MAPQLVTTFDQNNDSLLVGFQVAMKDCPPVKRRWDVIHTAAFRDNAAQEAAYEEMRKLAATKGQQLAAANAFERDMERTGKGTAKDRKTLASMKAAAALTNERIAKLREETKSLQRLYPAENFERFAVACHQRAHRAALAKYEAARKTGDQDQQGRIDASPADFMPSLTIAARDVATPESLEKVIVQLGKLEDKRRELLRERRQLELAPLPLAEVRQRVAAQIDSLGKEPDVYRAFRLVQTFDGRHERGSVRWPEKLKPGTGDDCEPDALSILFWACRPQIEKMLDDLLTRHAPKGDGMTLLEREARIAEIDKKLSADDFLESALVWRCLDHGSKIQFRHDLPPEAVLLADISFGEPSLGNG